MIKIENVETYGWEAAIRGMRNPMNSWEMSDSYFESPYEERSRGEPLIGNKDLKLMKTLSSSGDDHGKFMRFITVTADIVAPLYWWKEYDTYKVGTVANSCSSMHKIHALKFTLDDFSHEYLDDRWLGNLLGTIDALNEARDGYLYAVKCEKPLVPAKDYWWQMIQLLPSSYNQRRTLMLNYQVLKHMYRARKNHKLDEWVYFCKWIETLPYAKELVCGEV